VGRFLLTRLGLALVTLLLLSIIVFAMSQVLPGNVGRAILGPFADQGAVDRLNEELGVNRPLVTQYVDWIGSFVTGDLGQSLSFRRPVATLVGDAVVNSLKLAAVAFVMVVPLAILGGVISALRYGKLTDRAITLTGTSLTTVPDFVTGIVLIIVIGLWLEWLPITATPPSGAGPLTQIKHLILPAIPLVFVLFGYIARMARAGTIEALDSDYTRTAVLKGLSQRQVVRRHVLRNALLPTITVVATQTGYLIGGLLVVETLFSYNGIGRLIFQAAEQKDFPLLQSGVLVVGVVYMVATLVADLAYSLLNPRIRYATAE
jgi:peptide/nickel transport system permease protein